MNGGYIKLWRKSLDAGWIKNPKLWAFWTYCLMKASYKEFDAIVGLQVVHLMPGQFIFGRKKAAKETGLTEREIRTIIDFLKKAGNLTIKTTNKFSIITIINWKLYQSDNIENDHLNDQQVTSKGPLTRTKEHKNIFIVPSMEDVSAYCKERNNSINAQAFVDHYTANGWMVGKNKMKDWKAAVRTWERSGFNAVKQEVSSTW